MELAAMINAVDAYVLKRALTGMKPDESVQASALVNALMASAPADGSKRFAYLSGIVNADQALQSAVLAVDPAKPPQKQAAVVYVPELPPAARLKDAQRKAAEGACKWLDTFTAWAVKRSPLTPPAFLEAGAIWLLGLSIARRAYIQLEHERIFPHLYMLWVATTTRYAKSTGLNCIEHVANLCFPHMLMPHESTPEALVMNLSGRLPDNHAELKPFIRELLQEGSLYAGQRGLLIDEASSLLGAQKKDYMQGLMELLLKAYDAPNLQMRSTKSAGMVVMRNLGLSLLGATTPAAMSRYVGVESWETGQMARYALLFPDSLLPYPEGTGDHYNPPLDVTSPLMHLHKLLPEPKDELLVDDLSEPLGVLAEADAIKAYRAYARGLHELVNGELDERLRGNYGRLATIAMKVALSLAMLDWSQQAAGNHPRILAIHWYRAQLITESWRASLHRLLQALNETKDTRFIDRIAVLLRYSPSGLTIRDMARSTGIPVRDIHGSLEVLIDSGEVEAYTQKADTGPSTTVYKRCGYGNSDPTRHVSDVN
jgi:hypothetical protein